MSKTRVYSYLRFSDPKQAAGHSAERQLAYAKKWAEDNGAELDTSLTLRDEGLSAYHQRHIKNGALGTFMRAIEDGLIPPGSVLIVEGLDRLSRAEPILAQAQMAQIINAGISVVTASDGKIYNRERLKDQPMDLVYSLLVMIRAHEESETKSKRVSAAVRRQCEDWKAGKFKGVIRNGKDPAWLRWTGERFEEIPERAAILREMLSLWMSGNGYAAAWRTLHDRGEDMSALPATQASFYRMLSKKYLIGTKTITAGGEMFELEGYYPPLIDPVTFDRVIAARSRKKWKRGASNVPSIITGSGIAYCGYCGSVFIGQNSTNTRADKMGKPWASHRRMRCQHSSDSCVAGSCAASVIEKAIFSYCSDQLRLDALHMPSTDIERTAAAALARAKANVAAIEEKIDRVTAALLSDTEQAPAAFTKAARVLEEQLIAAKAEVVFAEEEVSKASTRQRATAREWRDIIEGILSLDTEARLKGRQMVIDTFERIAIYPKGIMPDETANPPIDVVLISHGGSPRLIKIDRKTGDLIELEDITKTTDS